MTRADQRLERDGLAILAAIAGGTHDQIEFGNRLGLRPSRVVYVVAVLIRRRLVKEDRGHCELTGFGWNALGQRQLTYERDMAQVALQDADADRHREVRNHWATRAHLVACEAELARANRQLRELQAQGTGGTDSGRFDLAVTETLPAVSADAR